MKLNKSWIICLFVLLLTGGTASAQLRFGIRGEVGVNKPSFTKDPFSVENMNDFKVGPTVELLLPVADFGFDASILYSNGKMNVKRIDQDGIGSLIEDVSSHSIDVPVNLKYRADLISSLAAFFAAGPYINVLLSEDELTYDDFVDMVKAKNFQAGINLGAGVELFERLAVGFNYRIKMTDDYSVSEPDFEELFNQKKGIWSVTATLFF